MPPTDGEGRPLARLRSFGGQPYAEVSYAIENISKLVRADFIHRPTYRDLPDTRNFGIRAGLQFRL